MFSLAVRAFVGERGRLLSPVLGATARSGAAPGFKVR
eukprot:COSAG05_NODE_17012_length_333_cov_1.307692_1_plen_36_part_01